MDEQQDVVQLESECIGGGKFKVTARWRGEPVSIDTLNLNSVTQRKRFITALCSALPNANAQAIDTELMKIADAKTPAPALSSDSELDVSCIVRPEQFFTPDVCGLTVPVISGSGGTPTAQWMLYLRWADGRRECCPLTNSIELPAGGARLWINPAPGEPSMNTPRGWSAESRRAWLRGNDAPDPANLFKRICERIAYFIDLPDGVAPGTTATLALWSILTYVYQAWDAIPYLYVGGPLSSGKTRLFEIESRLVFRPLQSSSLTGPALFRTLHDRGGVVLFDEAEGLRQSTPETAAVLSMLLAGYKRGGQATRLEPVGDTFRTLTFDVYGPKALACIAGLPSALASRCITVMMFRAGPDSPKPQRRIDADPEGWRALRDDLHALALEHGSTWRDLSGQSDVCPSGISGRAYELWQPLLVLASWVESHGASGLLNLMQEFALESINAATDDQVPEADEILLEILTDAVRRGDQPTPGGILVKAKERASCTFDRWIPRTVSRRLKAYGIPGPIKSHGERRFRNVTLKALRRIQCNYGIELEITDEVETNPSDSSTPIATQTLSTR